MRKYFVFAILFVLHASCATRIPSTIPASLIKESGAYISYTTHGVTIRPGQTVTIGTPSDKQDNTFRSIHMMTFGLILTGNQLYGTASGTSLVIKRIKYHKAYQEVYLTVDYKELQYAISVESAIKRGELVLQKPPQ